MNNTIQTVLEIPLPPDKFGQDGGKFYRAYDALAQEIDEDMVARLKEQLDGILIFAGLFAGVNSAFLALTLPMLSPDPTDDTNALLTQNNLILMQLAMGRNDSLPSNTNLPSTSFSPSSSILTVNVLFSLSLTFALISSFLAVIGRQWLVYYRKRSGGGPDRQRWEQLKRFLGAERWRLELILDDILPSLLQIGLIIFSVSLIIYLDSLSPAVAKIVGIPIYIGFASLIGGALCIVWDKFCPFQSPLSHSLFFIIRSVPLAAHLVKHGLVFSLGLLKDSSVRFLSHPRHAAAQILGTIQQAQLRDLFRTPLSQRVAWLKHVREEESIELLQIIALRRAICTSDDIVTLLHAAANIPAIDDPDLLQGLWRDQSFPERLMELYKDSGGGDQLTSRWADLTLSPFRLYSVAVIHLLLFPDHDLQTFDYFIGWTMELEWLYFGRVWVPAEIPSSSPPILITVSLVLSALSMMSASRAKQDKQRFCVYLVTCSDALRTPDWRLLSLIYWTVSQLATILESPPDDFRIFTNSFRGDLDTTLDSIDQALSMIAEHGANYSFDSDRTLTNLLRYTFQVFTSECRRPPSLDIHHVVRVVRAVEIVLRSAFWSAEAVEMGRKLRRYGLASILQSPIHEDAPLITANTFTTKEALDALTGLFESLRSMPRTRFSYQEDVDIVAMFATPMDTILSARMVFEANDNFQSGAIPEISQPASIQRAWDEFKFDIENLQVQHDLTRFRDPEHHWCYHSSR